MKELFILAIAGSAVAIWLRLSMAHAFALTAARRHCQEMDVQLLDQTVVLRGFRIARGPSGWWMLVKKYSFEFSTTGEQRYKGITEFVGRRRLRVQLDPHSI